MCKRSVRIYASALTRKVEDAYIIYFLIPSNTESNHNRDKNNNNHNNVNDKTHVIHTCTCYFHALRFCTFYLSRVMRKSDLCICENKAAADQRLCFHIPVDSTIPLLSYSEISSLYPPIVAVQPGLCRLCRTRSETRTMLFS